MFRYGQSGPCFRHQALTPTWECWEWKRESGRISVGAATWVYWESWHELLGVLWAFFWVTWERCQHIACHVPWFPQLQEKSHWPARTKLCFSIWLKMKSPHQSRAQVVCIDTHEVAAALRHVEALKPEMGPVTPDKRTKHRLDKKSEKPGKSTRLPCK